MYKSRILALSVLGLIFGSCGSEKEFDSPGREAQSHESLFRSDMNHLAISSPANGADQPAAFVVEGLCVPNVSLYFWNNLLVPSNPVKNAEGSLPRCSEDGHFAVNVAFDANVVAATSGGLWQAVTVQQYLPGGQVLTNSVTVHLVSVASCGATSDIKTSNSYLTNGKGTDLEPYRIYTAGALESIAYDKNAWTKSFTQCEDIDLTGYYSHQHPYFTIAGNNSSNSFTGSYDGLGHKIIGFTFVPLASLAPSLPVKDADGNVIRDSWSNIGLFGRLGTGAKIQNVSLEYVNIQSSTAQVFPHDEGISYGAVAGEIIGASQIKNVAVSGQIWGRRRVGGVVGRMQGTASLDQVHAEVTVKAWYYAGGLVGEMVYGASIKNSSTAVDLSALSQPLMLARAGGVVGEMTGHSYLDHVESTGDIYDIVHSVGGIVGVTMDSNILNVKSSVRIARDLISNAKTATVGGIAGSQIGAQSMISYALFTGQIKIADPSAQEVGGIVGHNRYASVSWSSNLGEISAGDFTGGLVGTLTQGASLTDSLVRGKVHGRKSVGGLVGWYTYNNTMARLYSDADVSGTSSVGGLIGSTFQASTVKVDDSFTLSPVTATSLAGRLIGQVESSAVLTLNHTYYFSGAWCTPNCPSVIGAVASRDWFYSKVNAPLNSWLFDSNHWLEVDSNGDGLLDQAPMISY